jgi:hypothetical protein
MLASWAGRIGTWAWPSPWTPPATPTSRVILWSRDFPTVVGPDTSYNDGSYDAFVAKVGAGGGGGMEPPQPPSNLRSTDSNAGAVTLAWNDNSDNETGFYLYRWDNSGWSRIATLGANVTTYTDTDPNCGQSRYRVSAYNVASESAMSNEVAVAIRCPLILIPGIMGSYIYQKKEKDNIAAMARHR